MITLTHYSLGHLNCFYIFKLFLVNVGWVITCEIILWWLSLDLSDNESKFVRITAWCRQAWAYVNPNLCRHTAIMGIFLNEVIRSYRDVLLPSVQNVSSRVISLECDSCRKINRWYLKTIMGNYPFIPYIKTDANYCDHIQWSCLNENRNINFLSMHGRGKRCC